MLRPFGLARQESKVLGHEEDREHPLVDPLMVTPFPPPPKKPKDISFKRRRRNDRYRKLAFFLPWSSLSPDKFRPVDSPTSQLIVIWTLIKSIYFVPRHLFTSVHSRSSSEVGLASSRYYDESQTGSALRRNEF